MIIQKTDAWQFVFTRWLVQRSPFGMVDLTHSSNQIVEFVQGVKLSSREFGRDDANLKRKKGSSKKRMSEYR